MRRLLRRGLIGVAAAALITTGSTGLASAAELPSPPPLPGLPQLPGLPGSGAGVPIWVLPGVDLGSVLGPTVPVPTEALAPVDGVLTQITG